MLISRVPIVYDCKHYLIAYKPWNVYSQPADQRYTSTHKIIMTQVLRSQLGDESIKTVHRLDKGVSGGMLIAKSQGAAKMFSRYLKLQGSHGFKMTRRYIAAVESSSILNSKDGVEYGIIESEGMVTKFCRLDQSYYVLELVTGKKHQIRRHLSRSLGTPIINDVKYGARSLQHGTQQIALHSAYIGTLIGVHSREHFIDFQEDPKTSVWHHISSDPSKLIFQRCKPYLSNKWPI